MALPHNVSAGFSACVPAGMHATEVVLELDYTEVKIEYFRKTALFS